MQYSSNPERPMLVCIGWLSWSGDCSGRRDLFSLIGLLPKRLRLYIFDYSDHEGYCDHCCGFGVPRVGSRGTTVPGMFRLLLRKLFQLRKRVLPQRFGLSTMPLGLRDVPQPHLLLFLPVAVLPIWGVLPALHV